MPDDFRLSDGGLVQVARDRIRVPGAIALPMRAQIAIAVAILWLPLALLAALEGNLFGSFDDRPFLSDIVPQVRFLIALPLLVLADAMIDPMTRSSIAYLTASGIVAEEQTARFNQTIAGMRRAIASIWPDIVGIVMAYAVTWLFRPGYGADAILTIDTSWLWQTQAGEVSYSLAGWWYLLISGPLFQVILFRWVWRFLVWSVFLYRVSKLPLRIQPTHPDLAGGLGYLGMAQQAFTVIFVAFATVASATVAHDIMAGRVGLMDVRLEIAVLVVCFIVVIYAPLLLFSKQLLTAKRNGLDYYGLLGYRQSQSFHQVWIESGKPDTGEALLKSTDPSAMADYTATFNNVRSIRIVPINPKSVVAVAAVLIIPFLPLVLTEYSIQDLFNRLADALV